MDIQNAYNNWSSTYDSDENLTRDLDQRVTENLLGARHFDSILEIGCGTGKNTEFSVKIGDHVNAVDFSEGMIERAKQKVQAENITFSVMNITQPWKFQELSFDLIICSLVLEHIEDLSFVFAEAARTLRPRGNFFVNELHPFRQYDGKKARFYREGEKIEVDAYVHHISDFFRAATQNGVALITIDEYWHDADEGKLPRILSMMFERR